jgi:hypothetical protein
MNNIVSINPIITNLELYIQKYDEDIEKFNNILPHIKYIKTQLDELHILDKSQKLDDILIKDLLTLEELRKTEIKTVIDEIEKINKLGMLDFLQYLVQRDLLTLTKFNSKYEWYLIAVMDKITKLKELNQQVQSHERKYIPRAERNKIMRNIIKFFPYKIKIIEDQINIINEIQRQSDKVEYLQEIQLYIKTDLNSIMKERKKVKEQLDVLNNFNNVKIMGDNIHDIILSIYMSYFPNSPQINLYDFSNIEKYFRQKVKLNLQKFSDILNSTDIHIIVCNKVNFQNIQEGHIVKSSIGKINIKLNIITVCVETTGMQEDDALIIYLFSLLNISPATSVKIYTNDDYTKKGGHDIPSISSLVSSYFRELGYFEDLDEKLSLNTDFQMNDLYHNITSKYTKLDSKLDSKFSKAFKKAVQYNQKYLKYKQKYLKLKMLNNI